MTSYTTLAKSIHKARLRGKSKYALGKKYGVAAAEITRIEQGHYPGEKVAARLGIPVVCHACHRRIPKKRNPTTPAEVPAHMEWWKRLTAKERDGYIKDIYFLVGR